MVGHAGHGHAGSSLGEGEAKEFGSADGVIIKEFVEITDAEEEQTIGVGGFEAGVLPHGGRVTRVVGGGRCHGVEGGRRGQT